MLLPLYYRLELTSIYSYLDGRSGGQSYKTGAIFFLIPFIIGASFRLAYLVAIVLQIAISMLSELPFRLSVAVTIILIWITHLKGN